MSQNRLLLLIIIFISIIAVFSFLSSPFFSVHNFLVSGNKIMNKNELINMLNSFREHNIWMIDSDQVRKRILNNKYIKKVKVNKKYPDTIKLNIEERRPLGKINNNGHYLVFDQSGYILEEGSLKSRAEVPLITKVGYSFSGNKISFSPIFKKVVQALASIQQSKITKIKSISKENKGEINLYLKSDINVYLGESDDLPRKVEILSAIIDRIKKQNLDVKYIDLKLVDKPVIKMNK